MRNIWNKTTNWLYWVEEQAKWLEWKIWVNRPKLVYRKYSDNKINKHFCFVAFHNSVLPSKPMFKGTPSGSRRSLHASPSPSPIRREYGHRLSTSPTPNRYVYTKLILTLTDQGLPSIHMVQTNFVRLPTSVEVADLWGRLQRCRATGRFCRSLRRLQTFGEDF